MPQRIKQHHIVPRTLQRQFSISGDDKRVWHSKREPDGRFPSPRLKHIKTAFMERNYYTVTLDGEPDDVVERYHYGEIDNLLGKLIFSATNALQKKITPVVSSESVKIIRYMIPEMIKRTPDFTGEYDDVEVARRHIQKTLSDPNSQLTFEQGQELDNTLKDENKAREYGRQIRVFAMTKTNRRLVDMMSEFSIKWAVSESKHSFILSRRMAYLLSNENPVGLKNRDVEIWMPISPKYAMVLVRDPNGVIPSLKYCSFKEVRQINRNAVATSTEIASHSKTLLKSLVMRQ